MIYISVCVLFLQIFSAYGLTQRRQASGGLRCYECSGVSDLQYCTRTVHCAADEECHTERVVDDETEVYYNSGCQKRQVCQIGARGRRSELHLCEGCCGSDLCNKEICHHPNNTASPGVHCFQCNNISSPLDCQNRVTCASGEQCITKEYADDQLQMRYDLGCESKTKCDLLQQYGKRNVQVCNECCHSPGCNRHLCVPDGNLTAAQTTAITTPANSSCFDLPDVDCKLANDSSDICAKRTLAATKYCRKFCGYCLPDGSTFPPTTLPPGVTRGTTEDPCKDSGSIDCKDLDARLHICADKTAPPTVMYCPKYCGLCSTSKQNRSASETQYNSTKSWSSGSTSFISTVKSPPTKSTVGSPSVSTLNYSDGTNLSVLTVITTETTFVTTPRNTTIRCYKCSGPPESCDIAIYEDDCVAPDSYCINHVTNLASGDRLIQRGCGNVQKCYKEWYLQTSDDDKCRHLTSDTVLKYDFECTYCCITDKCNFDLHPKANTLYSPSN